MLIVDKMQWQKEAEVVVLGFGLAGAAAALTACDEGAGVVILEKQPAHNHITNSNMAGGVVIGTVDVDAATEHMAALYRAGDGISWTDRDVLRAWAEYTAENWQWLESMGVSVSWLDRYGEHSQLPGHKSIRQMVTRGMGWGMMEVLEGQIKSRGIDVLYETPATRLLTDSRGRVVGVQAQRNGEVINVKASKAVVLCTGGFEYDEGLKLNYLRLYPAHFTGTPANTGDGIRMAQEVGAQLWHMNCMSGGAVAKVPEIPAAFRIDFAGRHKLAGDLHAPDKCGYLVVDKHGRRFFDESVSFLKMHAFIYEFIAYDANRLEYPRLPSYAIIDRRRIEAGPLPGVYTPIIWHHWKYAWSAGSRAEIEKGWVIQADSVKELAGKLGTEAGVLERTVKRYNEYCGAKEDADFNRPGQYLVPLDEPPYFGVKIWGGGPNTQGGPRRNPKAQILNGAGEPIPGLYGAGECGSVYGMFYPTGGGNLAECIAFGRIAGENAAREPGIV